MRPGGFPAGDCGAVGALIAAHRGPALLQCLRARQRWIGAARQQRFEGDTDNIGILSAVGSRDRVVAGDGGCRSG